MKGRRQSAACLKNIVRARHGEPRLLLGLGPAAAQLVGRPGFGRKRGPSPGGESGHRIRASDAAQAVSAVALYDDVYIRAGGVWKFRSMIAELFYTVPNGVGWTGDEMHYLRPKG